MSKKKQKQAQTKEKSIEKVRTGVTTPSIQQMASPITNPPGAYDRLLLKKWFNGSPAYGRDLERLIRLEYVLPNPDGGFMTRPGIEQYIPGVKTNGNGDPNAEKPIAPGLKPLDSLPDQTETTGGSSEETTPDQPETPGPDADADLDSDGGLERLGSPEGAVEGDSTATDGGGHVLERDVNLGYLSADESDRAGDSD